MGLAYSNERAFFVILEIMNYLFQNFEMLKTFRKKPLNFGLGLVMSNTFLNCAISIKIEGPFAYKNYANGFST